MQVCWCLKCTWLPFVLDISTSKVELFWLDSCCASSKIFSMSPLWMEEDDGTCSSPPTRLSSISSVSTPMASPGFPLRGSAVAGATGRGAVVLAVFPLISSSTQEPVRKGRL
ncbi:hypothetical protein CRUP_023909 [Coryphaenoides rupestris]|nr:hypothetical protein CRUP_023909 [Coryphaenoides rupestris]